MDIACTVLSRLLSMYIFPTIISIRGKLHNLLNYNMKKVILVTGVAVLALASIAGAYSFSANLTVGSTGADVSALQSALIAGGYSIPAGATGYFGSQTKAALAAYQTSVGLPAFGFFGPLTQAKLSGGSVAMTPASTACPAGYTCTANAPVMTATCPAGLTCTANTGTTVTTGTLTQITTPGVQGIMSVTQGPVSVSTAYAGQTKVPVLDARIQAQYSDIAVQSLQVDLGSSTNIYNYVYSKIYLIDPSTGNVLVSQPLNSSTVVQSGNNYIVGLAGFNVIVPKGTFKDIQVAVDLYPTILNGSGNLNFLGPQTLSIDDNGIRGVDGAGVNNYGPSSGTISQTITINQNQTLSATANVSLDASNPQANSVGVTNTSAGSYLGLPVLVFDVNAQGDNLHLHSATINFNTSGSSAGAAVNAAYLYQGSTPIMSASISNGVATFTNIPDGTAGATIPINTSVPFTVKVDVTGPASAYFAANVSASTSALTIYNSADSGVSVNGLATGNIQTVQGQGAVFSLSGTPTITKVVSNSDTSGNATDTYTATFNVAVQAVGTSVNLGLPGSTTPAFSASTIANLAIYVNGSSSAPTAFAPVVSYSQPTNTVLSTNGTSFQVGINQSVTVPVTFSFLVRNPGANVYAVQLNGINSSVGASTFMNGQTLWRTSSI
jgi:peptidoglycan hydrolase-like protein with peptidoglycan-binding domain